MYHSHSNSFPYKGLGRIFVRTKSEVAKVEKLIEQLDPIEYEGYYPEGLVTVFENMYFDVIPLGKFEVDLYKLYQLCLTKGIDIVATTTSTADYKIHFLINDETTFINTDEKISIKELNKLLKKYLEGGKVELYGLSFSGKDKQTTLIKLIQKTLNKL